MRRARRQRDGVDVWPVLSDTMLAFLLVLLIMLVFQVGKNIEVVSDIVIGLIRQVQSDQEKVEELINDLKEKYAAIDISTTNINEQEITLGSEALFKQGSADLSPQGEKLLAELVQRIVEEDVRTLREITVKGHTDNIPINTQQFPSNWELSTARASRIVRFLTGTKDNRKGIDPNQVVLVAAGYGEYSPIDSVLIGKNRRIELRLVYSNNPAQD